MYDIHQTESSIRPRTARVLNRLYRLEEYSLANYLRFAEPWTTRDRQSVAETIRSIAADQRAFAERIGKLIVARDGTIEPGVFPLRFTALNDLSLDYLIGRVLEDEERIVREVAAILPQLCEDDAAVALARELLAAEQAHLQALREVTGEGSRRERPLSAAA